MFHGKAKEEEKSCECSRISTWYMNNKQDNIHHFVVGGREIEESMKIKIPIDKSSELEWKFYCFDCENLKHSKSN